MAAVPVLPRGKLADHLPAIQVGNELVHAIRRAGVRLPLFDVRLETSNLAYDADKDGRFLITASVEQSATVPMAVVLDWQVG